jgi:hypothetical protein
MKEILLSAASSHDIEAQVRKILKGLGEPEPPFDLSEARELLRLDRQYYSSKDDSILREKISRLTVAGKQLLARPKLLLEVVRKLDLRALFLPDQRRILLDSDVPQLKHRWNESHEIAHSIIPWHQGMMGDHDLTLTPACHDQLEAEANYGAGQLLFLGSRFEAEARDMSVTLDSVLRLSESFSTIKYPYVDQSKTAAYTATRVGTLHL